MPLGGSSERGKRLGLTLGAVFVGEPRKKLKYADFVFLGYGYI